MTSPFKLNHTGNVGVATAREWLEIDVHTPRGVKLNLLTIHGVAVTGILHAGNLKDFKYWEPVARVPKDKQ